MPPVEPPRSGREYWRSLNEYANTPQFRDLVAREFPSMLEDVVTPATRRRFLQLMGASLALGGLGLQGCRRWPQENIMPFAHRPEGRIPGVPEYFATAMEVGGVAEGLLIESVDGRPIKVEGNRIHPINQGATSAVAQASVLDLYDPDRARVLVRRTRNENGEVTAQEAADWPAFIAFARKHFGGRGQGGRGVAVVSEATSSETTAFMRRAFEDRFPNARWYDYEPLSRDAENEGTRLAFGEPYRVHYNMSEAAVIVCLDADPLATHPAAIKNAREFAGHRRPEADWMNRLYAIESRLSITGMMADHRLATRARNVPAVANALAAALAAKGLNVPGVDAATATDLPDDAAALVDALAADLLEVRDSGGRSLIAVGQHQPAEVHALALLLNEALGNFGSTIALTKAPDVDRPPYVESLRELASAIEGGLVDTVLILGGNPVYNAPGDIPMAALLAGVTTVHLSDRDDETSRRADWHLPRAHYLEAWSDARAWDGTLTIVQPLISPLYGGKTPAEVLALILGDEVTTGYELVRRALQPILEEVSDEPWEKTWRRALHDGLVPGTQFEPVRATPRPGDWLARLNEASFQAGVEVAEVVLAQDYLMYDGRYANNGWLQELPDPITKITWDNAALMSVATAAALGLEEYGFVRIRANDTVLTVPAHVVPGHADGSITLPVGYGRTAVGRVGEGVGVDTYALRTSGSLDVVTEVEAEAWNEEEYQLAVTQDHHVMDTDITERGKQVRLPNIVWEARLDRFLEEGADAFHPPGHHAHHTPEVSLWEEHKFEASIYRWGMAIDLSTCIGCSACVIACQAENNVPIVGRDQVLRGREMHWLRIDRYYKFKPAPDGDYDTNTVESVALQPMLCQHCENAPCESVCPVAATLHDAEGLNVMVYNRCVGTRYCSNNCPYKVRRFNFYDWHDHNPRDEGLEPPALMFADQQHLRTFEGPGNLRRMYFNPEVTVRSRGVMEKCTFCVQRINRAKIEAKNEWVRTPPEERENKLRPTIPDGTITTACAQACPTHAITFGDLSDRTSRVYRLHRNPRSYACLEYLNTQPRNRYLGRVKNPNPVLAPRVPGPHEEPGPEHGEPEYPAPSGDYPFDDVPAAGEAH